ncbi:9586_t:CDS:2 [Entrophospora sp. SA101]|nr:9586_t:CDS:2 [Entrophospora sp. SA101]
MTFNNRPPVIIIIHGGAWRSGDKSELESFCEKLTKINVKHPIHIEDVAKAIYWVYQNSDKFGYNHDRIYLIGQSCGAFIATHLVLLSEKYFGVVCIEGIFDIPLLLKTWPEYIEFIRLPFEDELVDLSQSKNYYKILKDKKTIVKLETSLKGTHMGIMYTIQLVDKIWEFIISIESN